MRLRRRGATTTTTAGRICTSPDFSSPRRTIPITCSTTLRGRVRRCATGARQAHDASHGVQWVDFDGDGALDLALANNDANGGHYLFRNLLPPSRRPAFACRRRGRRARPSHEGGRRSACLRRRNAPPDFVRPRRHRWRLLLAERHAGACRHRRRLARRYRGDLDDEIRAPNHGAAEPIRPSTGSGRPELAKGAIRDPKSGMPIRIAVP